MVCFPAITQVDAKIMNKNEALKCIEINPSSAANAVVIWMHGLGADGHDFTPIIPDLGLPRDLNIRFIFPNAPIRPVTINNGYEMRAWYDITSISSERASDVLGIKQSVDSIKQIIEAQIALGISSERIILAGFSQGSAMALTTLLHCDLKLAAAIALSGYLPMQLESLRDAHEANKQTPIFMGHGTEDMIVPFMLGQMTYNGLNSAGYNTQWHAYQMAHSVCMEEIKDIGKFLTKILG